MRRLSAPRALSSLVGRAESSSPCWKTGWSLLLGAGLGYGVVAPAMVDRGVIAAVSYREIVRWTLWGGGAVLLSSGLLSLAFLWRSVARSFRGLSAAFRRSRPDAAADTPSRLPTVPLLTRPRRPRTIEVDSGYG